MFIDANCVPENGWLRLLLAPIRDEGEQIVAGSYRSAGTSGLRDEAGAFLAGCRYIPEAPTINLAVTREAFRRVGGFDESFDYGSDIDFTWRAIDAGLRIRYLPDAVVTHDWGGIRDEVRRSYLYGQARFRLYAKHRHRWRDIFGRDLPVIAYPLFLLSLPLALARPGILGLLAVPLVKNRGHRPALTVAEHLVFGSGVLVAVVRSITVGLTGREDPQRDRKRPQGACWRR